MVYGERIGCTIESSWKLVDCVRKGRSFGELANIEFKPEIGTWPWSPVVQVMFIKIIGVVFAIDYSPENLIIFSIMMIYRSTYQYRMMNGLKNGHLMIS